MAIPTVTAPSAEEIIGNAGSGTRRLGQSLAQTNISEGQRSFAAGAQMLATGGALAINPALQAQYDARSQSILKGVNADTRKRSALETQIRRAQDVLGKAKDDKGRAKAQANLDKLTQQLGSIDTRLTEATTQINQLPGQLSAGQPNFVDLVRQTNPEMYAQLTRAQGFADQMGTMTDAGRQFMQEAQRGFQAREIDRGAAGEQLYGRATQMAQSTGQLSPEAARDAVQSARQAFSARGLGTSAGSAAAELLNRDQYSRNRMFQDLGFANQVSQQDLERRFFNEDARRAGTQLNLGMMGDAVNYEQNLQNRGLGASLQMAEVQNRANPYNVMMGFDPFGGRQAGSQATGPATQAAVSGAEMNLMAQGFNVNSAASQLLGNQNLQAARMAAGATQNAGMMGMFGGIGGGALAGVGLAI